MSEKDTNIEHEFNEVSNSVVEDAEFQKLLDDFIASELSGIETGLENKQPQPKSKPVPPQPPRESQPAEKEPLNEAEVSTLDKGEDYSFLKNNEKNLYVAYRGFIDAINYIAQKHNLPKITASVKAAMLSPNYKPSIGKIIQEDVLKGWDTMIKAYPDEVSKINPDSTDDELLDFAENAIDNQLTLGIISHVETAIELEGCDLYYQDRLIKTEKRRLEKELHEEHQRRARKCKRYILEIEQKRFPINAERLINNYFKAAQKDVDGAYKVLTTNPATFAPIQTEKIQPRFFGMIKPKPKDGFRINRLIGEFLKRLKA